MLDNTEVAGRAETAPRRESLTDRDPPIDLVHLARQCQGDPGLEEELLGLFRVLARSLAAQLSDPQMRLELKAGIAHKLRGSALAMGARRVACAAEAIEEMARSAGGNGPSDEQMSAASLAIAALQVAVDEAVTEIDRLRR